MVALARLAAAERAPISAQVVSGRASWLASLEALVRGLSAPQWAMAAAAVVVFAISLPLPPVAQPEPIALCLRPVLAETSAGETAQAESRQLRPAAKVSPEKSASVKSEDAKQTNKPESNGLLAANKEREDRAVPAEQKKTAPEIAPQPIDETQRKAENQAATSSASPARPVPPRKRNKPSSIRIGSASNRARTLRKPKQAPAEEQDADKEKSRRAESAAAPPPPPASSSSRLKAPGVGRLGLRDSAGEAVRPRANYLELRGKKFFLD